MYRNMFEVNMIFRNHKVLLFLASDTRWCIFQRKPFKSNQYYVMCFQRSLTISIEIVAISWWIAGALKLTWFIFNLDMGKLLYLLWSWAWNSVGAIIAFGGWILAISSNIFWACNYLSLLRSKLIHVSIKGNPEGQITLPNKVFWTLSPCVLMFTFGVLHNGTITNMA